MDSTPSGGVAPPVVVQIGETIGNYRILSLLGEGGMGVVYKAEQQNPRREVALKIIRGRHHTDEFHVKMFHHEAASLGRLRHPNIAAIYESGHTADGRHYFAMKLLRGATLDAFGRRLEGVDGEDAAAGDAGPHHSPSGSGADGSTAPLTCSDVEFRLRLFLKICEAVN